MSCSGDTRWPPLAARAQPSRRAVISEALSRLSRSATSDGDTFVVHGQKVWSTWAQWSDYGFLLARTDPDAFRELAEKDL